MKFTPGQEWTWGFAKEGNDERLIINLVSDEGVRYCFKTLYKSSDLAVLPKNGESLCIEDACLLTDFQEGLYAINVNKDEVCLDLGLNAVACSRFVRNPNPSGRFFLPFGNNQYIKRGQVVSLYGKAGGIGDFFVLDEIPDGNLYRLMLLNREWDLGMHLLKVGAMLRVSADRICAFRSIKGARTAQYA